MTARHILNMRRSVYASHRASLQKYIAQLPFDFDLKLQDWLATLELNQLRIMENDATRCYSYDDLGRSQEISAVDLIDIASMAYSAEQCFSENSSRNADFEESLLIGLAVAVCIERLKRAGWVAITGRVEILLQDPRPC